MCFVIMMTLFIFRENIVWCELVWLCGHVLHVFQLTVKGNLFVL